MAFRRITEEDSEYDHLEKKTTGELLSIMNREDKSVAPAVEKAIPAIEILVEAIVDKLLSGGKLFYIGAGTSGRLGVLDASECPPTFGVSPDLVTGIIAGGDKALRSAVEGAEDDGNRGWEDLKSSGAGKKDLVIGLASGGTTPYVTGALKSCREAGILTGCITCNPEAPVTRYADFPVVAVTGPEIVTGSTRLKAGTAQKLILNMISTAVMIRLGRVEGNKMVNLQLTNEKLMERGVRMVMDATGIRDPLQARELLKACGSVREAISAADHKK